MGTAFAGLPMIRPLTARQSQVLAVLMLSMDVYRTPPPVRMIGKMTGRSSSATAYCHLLTLEKKGYLTRPYIRPGVFVPTIKADLWWEERKRITSEEQWAEIWQADRAGVGETG